MAVGMMMMGFLKAIWWNQQDMIQSNMAHFLHYLYIIHTSINSQWCIVKKRNLTHSTVFRNKKFGLALLVLLLLLPYIWSFSSRFFLYQVKFFGGKVAKAQIGLNFHWQGKVGDDGHPNSWLWKVLLGFLLWLAKSLSTGGKVTSDYIALHKVGSKTTIRPKKREEDSNSIRYLVSINFLEHSQFQFPAQFLVGYSSYLQVND